MEMERHQFDQRARTLQRAIDHRTTPSHHPTPLIQFIDDQDLGLPPRDAELASLPLTSYARSLDGRADSHATAIDLDRDPLAGELGPSRQRARSKLHQAAGAHSQHLRPQLAGDASYGLLIELQTPTGQLGLRRGDRQKANQAPDFGLDIGAAPVADTVGRQFGVKARPLDTASLTAPLSRCGIQRPHRDGQTAQEAHHHRPSFFSTGRSGTSAAARTCSTWWTVSGASLAWARRLATTRSACRRACSWTSRSMAAKLAGSRTRRASHSAWRARNPRPAWSTTVAGEPIGGPSGRRRLPACGSPSLCSSDSILTSIAGPLRVAPRG